MLAESAARPGFARAALRFIAELERSMVEPPRLIQALRSWAGDGPRAAYAEEIGELYRRYREGMDAAGLVDDDLYAWGALPALRARPSAWAGTPVFVYGFDDFTELEFRTIEELAVYAEADVVVSLPFEPGREAFKATATLRERLGDRRRGGSRSTRSATTTTRARAPRCTPWSARCSTPGGEPADAGRGRDPARRRRRAGRAGAVRGRGGGAAARRHAAGRRGGGVPRPARGTRRWSSRCSAPTGSRTRWTARVPFAHTGVGRGLLALLRCALLEGTADDLLAYLRTPGLLREPGLADRLEADVRRRGERTADGARALWEERPGRWPLDAIDELRDAPDAARAAAAPGLPAGAPVQRALPARRARACRAPSWTTRARSAPATPP